MANKYTFKYEGERTFLAPSLEQALEMAEKDLEYIHKNLNMKVFNISGDSEFKAEGTI